jgi:hypothetical protein
MIFVWNYFYFRDIEKQKGEVKNERTSIHRRPNL